jgi:uncharacterized protein YgiB involved in biofilm formation
MPLSVESLTKESTADQVQTAIAASIKQCVDEGGEQKQCQAMAFSIAHKQTSSDIRRGLEPQA